MLYCFSFSWSTGFASKKFWIYLCTMQTKYITVGLKMIWFQQKCSPLLWILLLIMSFNLKQRLRISRQWSCVCLLSKYCFLPYFRKLTSDHLQKCYSHWRKCGFYESGGEPGCGTGWGSSLGSTTSHQWLQSRQGCCWWVCFCMNALWPILSL